MKSETYKLFLAPYSKEALETAMNVPFSRATSQYVLVYKRGHRPSPLFKPLQMHQLRMLGDNDMHWLREVNVEIASDFLRRHSEEEKNAAMKFIEDFQRELEKEPDEVEKKGGEVNGK